MSDCGCELEFYYDACENAVATGEILYCPLHAAAAQMREALKALGGVRPDCECEWWHAYDCVHWDLKSCTPSAGWASECSGTCKVAREALAAAEARGPCPIEHNHSYACVGLMDFGSPAEAN